MDDVIEEQSGAELLITFIFAHGNLNKVYQ